MVPFSQSSSLVPPPAPVVFSPIPPTLVFMSPTGVGFFDEHPAISSITPTLTIAIALANVERLFTQPPRPCWTGIIAFSLRQSGNYLPVADHQYVNPRVMAARRAERQVASVGRPARILVGAVAIGHLGRVAAAYRDRPDIEASVVAALVGQLVALGREGRRGVVIAAIGYSFRRAARETHHVDLRRARAIRGERQGRAVGRNSGTQ